MANRRLLDFSNHIAADSLVATITSNNRNAHQIHRHAHLAKAKTLFLSLALVSCLISINCASFGRQEWRNQPKYRLYPTADDSSANDELPTDDSRQLNDLFDRPGTSSGYLQPARERLSSSDNSQLLNYLLDSSGSSESNFAPASSSYSAANPIQFVGLVDDLPPSEFGYVQSDPADYRPHHARLLPSVDLRDSASFGSINNGGSLGDDFQSFTDPRETLLSLSTQQQNQLDQASVLPSGTDKIPNYSVGENSQTIDNSATTGNVVAYQSPGANDGETVARGDDENFAATGAKSDQPAGKLTTLLEEDEAAGEASEKGADKKSSSSDKDQAESSNQSVAIDAKQEQQTATTNITDNSEHQQELLRRFVSIWRNNASSKAAEHPSSSQQQAITGDLQGNSGGILSSLYDGFVRFISYMCGKGSSFSDNQQQNQQIVVNGIHIAQNKSDNNNRATETANQDKSGASGDNKGSNRANTKPSVSTPTEPDATTKSESLLPTAASGSRSFNDRSRLQDNNRMPKAVEDNQQQTNNDNFHTGKQQTSQENTVDDQESLASSINSSSSSSPTGANVESSPVGTFMASELDSAKVVGSNDDVQIASDDKHNLIMTTTGTGDNKRNIFHMATSGLQHNLQQPPSTIGEHKVSLMRHSSLIVPLGSNDEFVVSTSPQQSGSLLGRYINSPSSSDGSNGPNLVFNLRNSQLSKHRSAETNEAGGLSLDDEYTQMSHRSYSRRLHPDGEVYGQFAGLRPSQQGSSSGSGGSFARALPIVGARGRISDDDQGGSFGNAMNLVQKTNDAYFLVMVAAFCVMAMAVVLATGLFAYRVQQQRKSTSDSDYPTYGVVGPNNMNGKCGGAAAFVGGYFASNLNNHHANGGAGGGPGSTTTGGSSLSISGKHLADLYSVSGDSGIVTGVHNNSIKNQHIHSGTLSAICGGATGGGSAKRANPNANLDGNGSGGQSGSGGAGNQQGAGNNFMANQNAARMYHYQHQKQQMIISDRASNGRHTSASDLDSEDENDDGSYTVYECPGLASAHEMEIKNPLFNDDRSP